MGEEIARKYDLTEKLMVFLDRHLIFPLLESLSSHELYPANELDQLKYDLLKDTYMTDYTNNLWLTINGADKIPSELQARKDEIIGRMTAYETANSKVLDVLENPEVIKDLKQDKKENLKVLESKYGVTVENINSLYEFGQFEYNCGKYREASDMLYHFRLLSTDQQLITSATWGKFSGDILSMSWDSALEEQQKLKEIVDQRSSATSLQQLNQRVWLIHWSLFPFFNTKNGKELLCDMFFSSLYISTIQATCPWILRYLTASVVALNDKTRHSSIFQKRLKDLIRVIAQEDYEYRDPLTQFIHSLYVDYDFQAAQDHLTEAEYILKNDFFLAAIADDFLESARHLISEVYCRIHQRIDVAQLSERLNLTKEQGEKWIANLIQDTKLDAKIDESQGTVIMNHPQSVVYQQIIEKTKGLTFRSNQVLQGALNKQDNLVVS